MLSDTPRLESARAYVGRGWPVLPLWWPAGSGCACGVEDCSSVGKHPIGQLVPHGVHEATIDPDVVATWWRAFPHANVGIGTGAESGLIVLDIDGPAGREAVRQLVVEHGRFDAVWAQTGSGGWHAYLAHPGVPVPNSAGRVGEGLDVRGDGGYVVAPPSRHASARRYRWLHAHAERAVRDGRALAPAPDWLLERMAAPEWSPSLAPDGGFARPLRLHEARAASYVAAAVEREAEAVAHAAAGHRNDRLNRAAYRLGQLVGAGLVDEATVTDALVTAALLAGLGERKIRSTIQSGLRAGTARPRQVEIEHLPPASRACGREVERC